jgi:hypothetical protein
MSELTLAAKIARTIDDTPTSLEDAVGALVHVTAYVLSGLCPECRRSLSAAIGAQLPDNVERLAHAAADLPVFPECPHPKLN